MTDAQEGEAARWPPIQYYVKIAGVVGAVAALPITAAGSVIVRSSRAARMLATDQPDPAGPDAA